VYDKARSKLFHELRSDRRWNIKWEWNACALEKAIRKVEAKRGCADRRLDDLPSGIASNPDAYLDAHRPEPRWVQPVFPGSGKEDWGQRLAGIADEAEARRKS